MARYLFLAFIVVPILELYLLIGIGRQIGPAPTVGLVLVMAMLGAALAKREGLRVMRSWQAQVAQGRVPEEGILSGVLVLVGGLLLIVPGVITDVLGLFLIIPPTRRWVAERVRRSMERGMKDGSVRVTVQSWGRVQEVRPPQQPFEQPVPPSRQIPGEVDAEFTDDGSNSER
ncbi:FxsA family protein [Hyalangium versicolor]|uniref:FxsA family protein n=1 Tax=Hyalangium versicolor TaxID=2861190 RepID=UPI001CC8F987|nr:FxsA family protein [Hyalangium versicolor]